MHPRLTLLSSSRNHGGGYLGQAIEEIASLFQEIRRVAFIPFALHDHQGYDTSAGGRLSATGLQTSTDPAGPEGA